MRDADAWAFVVCIAVGAALVGGQCVAYSNCHKAKCDHGQPEYFAREWKCVCAERPR